METTEKQANARKWTVEKVNQYLLVYGEMI